MAWARGAGRLNRRGMVAPPSGIAARVRAFRYPPRMEQGSAQYLLKHTFGYDRFRGFQAEVIDPRTLVPLDKELILESVRKTGRLNLNAGYWDIFWPQMLQGFSMGLLFVPLTTITNDPIPRERMGNATSLFNLMRNIGGSVGIAAAEYHHISAPIMYSHFGPGGYGLSWVAVWVMLFSVVVPTPPRVALLSNERSRAVKFSIEKGKVDVTSSSPDLGEAHEEIAKAVARHNKHHSAGKAENAASKAQGAGAKAAAAYSSHCAVGPGIRPVIPVG